MTRRLHSPLTLNQREITGVVYDGYPVGVCAVLIRQVRCSESHPEDFDADLRPFKKRTQARWLSIARARLVGVALPPAELLQPRDVYCIRDGHHRISVARTMGQEYVEGEVMVWELGAQPLCEHPATVAMPRTESPKNLSENCHVAQDAGAGDLDKCQPVG